MRKRTSASHACGSTPFILAVTMRLYVAAARWPPRSEPQNCESAWGPDADRLSKRLNKEGKVGSVAATPQGLDTSFSSARS